MSIWLAGRVDILCSLCSSHQTHLEHLQSLGCVFASVCILCFSHGALPCCLRQLMYAFPVLSVWSQLCITVPVGDCALFGISSPQFSCYFVSWGYFVRLLRLGAVFQILLFWILMLVNSLFVCCFLLCWTCSVVMCIPWGRVSMFWFFVSPLSVCKNSLFFKQLQRVRFLFVEKKYVTTIQLIFCLLKKRCEHIYQLALAILLIVHLVANYWRSS